MDPAYTPLEKNLGNPVVCERSLPGRDLEAVIKSTASAASLGVAEDREDDGGMGSPPATHRETALAANLITASKSLPLR